jgi:hypothetical protein
VLLLLVAMCVIVPSIRTRTALGRHALSLSTFDLATLARSSLDTVRRPHVLFAAIGVTPSITTSSLDTLERFGALAILAIVHDAISNIDAVRRAG